VNKKILFACLLLILASGFTLKAVFASQETDDYSYQYEQYQQVYKEFTVARDSYLKYQTLQSKDTAITATKNLILKRNDAIRAYFLALKWKLRSTPGVVSTERQAQLISQLDQQVIWLENESKQVQALANPTLDDLFILSDRVENKKDDLNLLSYQSLFTVLLGKANSLQTESVGLTSLLADKVSRVDATAAGQLKEWVKAVENTNYASQKEIETAEAKYEALTKERREDRFIQLYRELQTTLDKFKNLLTQALGFQEEINNSFEI
jgi:hypothetical protein